MQVSDTPTERRGNPLQQSKCHDDLPDVRGVAAYLSPLAVTAVARSWVAKSISPGDRENKLNL